MESKSWAPFLERPGNLTGPESDFKIKASRKVGCLLTSNKVHFVSLAENFTALLLITLLLITLLYLTVLLKLPSGMENKTA